MSSTQFKAVNISTGTVSTGSTSSQIFATMFSTSITTIGRPVEIYWQPQPLGLGTIRLADVASTGVTGFIRLLRDASPISEWKQDINVIFGGPGTPFNEQQWRSHLNFVDQPSRGTYTYTLEGRTLFPSQSLIWTDVRLVAIEL